MDETIINYELIEDVLEILCGDDPKRKGLLPPSLPDKNEEGSSPPSLRGGTILIFLPGLGEIRHLLDRLNVSRRFGRCSPNNRSEDGRSFFLPTNQKDLPPDRFIVIAMHSALSAAEHNRVFHPTPMDACK